MVTIFSSIVGKLEGYGAFYSLYLAFHGSPIFKEGLVKVGIGALSAKRVERFRDPLLFVFSRQFGRNKTEEPLKGCNAQTNLLRISIHLIYTCGLVGTF